MNRFRFTLYSSVLFAAACSLYAQTYTPKTIRIDAPPGTDTAEPLRIAALPSGAPLTKQQIEAALGRLADTGLFSDIGYTVNDAALVIKLTPAASSQVLPARYGNFVWWKPGELEPLVESRLPIFKGSLPASGTLTEQVEAVLVDLLRQKNVEARVTATLATDVPNGPLTATNLTISHPGVVVGDVHFQNGIAALASQASKVADRLRGEDFDIHETYDSIRLSVGDIYQNEGYLDVSNSTPTYSSPRKDLDRYTVDITTSIQPGEVYHISHIDIQSPPPLAQADVAKAIGIKPGDHASPLAQRVAAGEVAKAYADRGYLEANADFKSTKDSAAHTLAYNVTVSTGEIYHFASVDTSALSPEQQAAFAKSFHAASGVVADAAVRKAVFDAVQQAGLARTISLSLSTNRAQHTVVYAIKPSAAPQKH